MPLARALFPGLLRVGFRNIHAVIHHQTEHFAAGMPTDLAFGLVAHQTFLDWLERIRGEGWWGGAARAGCDLAQTTSDDPFNWVKLHPLLPVAMQAGHPFDHAGVRETSLLLAQCPGARSTRPDRRAGCGTRRRPLPHRRT